MSKHFVDQVVEFNQTVLKIEQRAVDMLKQNEFEISMKCLQEEVDEDFQRIPLFLQKMSPWTWTA